MQLTFIALPRKRDTKSALSSQLMDLDTASPITSRASEAPSRACTLDPAGGGGNSCRDHMSEPCFLENNLRHEPPKRGSAQEPDV